MDVITDQNWVLSVGTFLPLVGVALMLFIPRAEEALFRALRSRQGEHTTILITHRLANITHADQIFVLDRGALVESGTHHALMAADGLYAQLFTMQAAGYRAWA